MNIGKVFGKDSIEIGRQGVQKSFGQIQNGIKSSVGETIVAIVARKEHFYCLDHGTFVCGYR